MATQPPGRPKRSDAQGMPLLRTKLYIPPVRSEWVSRPRLIERLYQGFRHRLTLISAPAGFGKTTLVSAWVWSKQDRVESKEDHESASEDAAFLNQVMGLNLSAEDIAALERRTEGGASAYTWLPLQGKGAKMSPALSDPLPAATILYWTTCLKKSWNSSPKTFRVSCCRRPSSID